MVKDTFVFYKIEPEIQIRIVKSWSEAKKRFERYFKVNAHLVVTVASCYEQYCKLVKEVRSPWGVSKEYKGNVFLYNPKLWTVEKTGHNLDQLIDSLCHELVHCYFKRKKKILPLWLEEGLAVLISQEEKNSQRDKDWENLSKQYGIPEILEIKGTFSNQKVPALAYLTSYKLVKFIKNRIGKRKFVDELEKLDYQLHFKNFKESYEKR